MYRYPVTKRHVLKAEDITVVKLHAFPTSALVRGEWSESHSGARLGRPVAYKSRSRRSGEEKNCRVHLKQKPNLPACSQPVHWQLLSDLMGSPTHIHVLTNSNPDPRVRGPLKCVATVISL
jgi:hypothetical protein